jgi:hypothetical protein
MESLSTPLLLLTACRDHIGDINTCRLCKSREILSNPGRFEGVDSRIRELARACADNMESLSEADIDLLDNLHMRDAEDEDSHESADSSRPEDSPSGAAGAPQTPPSSSAHTIRLDSVGGARSIRPEDPAYVGEDPASQPAR